MIVLDPVDECGDLAPSKGAGHVTLLREDDAGMLLQALATVLLKESAVGGNGERLPHVILEGRDLIEERIVLDGERHR